MKGVPKPDQRLLYTTGDAARYARTTPSTVTRWLRGYDYPTKAGVRHSAPVTAARPSDGLLLTFADLVEVATVAAARRAGVTMPNVRAAMASASQLFGWDRPLLRREFQVAGRDLFIVDRAANQVLNMSKSGQVAWDHIRDVLRTLDYEHDLASRWWPAGRERPIVIDPRISFGRPYLHPKGVPTAVVMERFDAGEPLAEIAADLEITPTEAEDALRFERTRFDLAA